MKKISYRGGRIDDVLQYIAKAYGSDEITLRDLVYEKFPELNVLERCPNCEASMVEYIYTFDVFNALLLVKMGQLVRDRLSQGIELTVANQIHVPTMAVPHSLRCRTTMTAKLGLIAKLVKPDGRQVHGYWVITERGFRALQGEPVPKYVKVWRKQIIEHYEELATIGEAFQTYLVSVEDLMANGKNPRHDHREDVLAYNRSDWVTPGGVHEGKLTQKSFI